MSTLLSLATAEATPFILAAVDGGPGETISATLRAWVGPIVLLIIGFFALKFLMNNQVTAFITFLVVAACVSLIFYYPGILTSIAGMFYEGTGGAGTWQQPTP